MAQWHYAINRKEMGPIEEAELQELAQAGALRPCDLVWQEGMSEWAQAGSCAEFFPEGFELSDPRDRAREPAGSRRRSADEDGSDYAARRRTSAGWVLALCVTGAVVLVVFVGVIAYLVLQNGSGPRGLAPRGPVALGGNQRVWEEQLTIFDPFDADPARPGCHCRTYTYHMTAGTVYVIDMEGLPPIDAYLRLEDPNHKEVARDDDGGPFQQDARIVYMATQTGVHTIFATTCDAGQVGNFTLKVTP